MPAKLPAGAFPSRTGGRLGAPDSSHLPPCLLSTGAIAPGGAEKRDAMASEMVTVKVGGIPMRGDDEWQVTDIGMGENGESVVTLGSVDKGATELGASGAGIPGIQLPEHP